MDADTHNFFLSTWKSDSTPQFHQEQAENNSLDYFSYRPVHQARHQLDHLHLPDSLNEIFETFGLPTSDKITTTVELESTFDTLNQNALMQSIAACATPSVLSITGFEIPPCNEQNAKTGVDLTPVKFMTELIKNEVSRTSVLNGQITPGDSPVYSSQPVEEEGARRPNKKSDRDHCRTVISPGFKAKRSRKRRKVDSKEQKEIKHQEFLERNRIAAGKCRQNKKKWNDDLQTKVRVLRVDNMEKKAMCVDMENEISFLKSSIVIHSKSCTDKDIAAWVEREKNRAHL